jgi:DNA/RNA endonuclease YhcR with UshA esterase domain
VFTSGSSSELWVQDATGGIAVFSGATTRTPGLALGDSVHVRGVRSTFNGQAQLGGTAALPLVVTRYGGSAPVTPLAQTGAEILARTAEGQLVTTTLTIATVGGGTGAAFNVTGTHADGSTVTIRSPGGNTGLTRDDYVIGETYQITGVLTQFNGTAQIKPRGDADVVQQ